MSLADIKLNNAAQRGFTIVELLIVVVVIAILAAITIVSYNGITTRANASAAKSTAATWQKKIELYQAEEGAYPFARTSLTDSSKSYHVESSTPLGIPTPNNGKTTVNIEPCGTSTPTNDATTTGLRITYYDYEAGATDVVNVGNVTSTCATAWSN